MMGYIKIPTSNEVWTCIHIRHPDLKVFGTYSFPMGNPRGNPNIGEMYTEYGFRESPIPLIAARTAWVINWDDPAKREGEKTDFWLCFPVKEDAE